MHATIIYIAITFVGFGSFRASKMGKMAGYRQITIFMTKKRFVVDQIVEREH